MFAKSRLLFLALFATLVLGCGAPEDALPPIELNPVVMEVNGLEVRQEHILSYLESGEILDVCKDDADVLRAAVDQLTEELLYASSLEKSGRFLSETELASKAEEIGIKVDRQKILAGGILDPLYRKWLVDQHLSDISKAVTVEDDEVEAACANHPATKAVVNGMFLRQIVTKDRKNAELAEQLLADGKASFEDVARVYSESPDRGALRFFSNDILPKDFASRLLLLKEGERSEIMDVPDGLIYILMVERQVEDRPLTCEELAPQLERLLRERKEAVLLTAEMKNLDANAQVTLHEETLDHLFD